MARLDRLIESLRPALRKLRPELCSPNWPMRWRRCPFVGVTNWTRARKALMSGGTIAGVGSGSGRMPGGSSRSGIWTCHGAAIAAGGYGARLCRRSRWSGCLMNTAAKGRRAEHRARALLEASGFSVCRAAGSKGPADLIAWDGLSIRFISVKSGTKYLSGEERKALQALAVPPNASRESWRFPDRCREPLIDVL
jgi:hypothetical protein